MKRAYFWANKIHRLTMWFAAIIGALMAVSGFFMHREIEGESIPSFVNVEYLRFLHNKFSVVFGPVLWVMILTGLTMWIVPKIQKRNTEI